MTHDDDHNRPHVSDDDLLDWSLGQSDGPHAERAEESLRSSAEQRERADAVHRILAVLDKYKVDPPDEGLAERVLDEVTSVRNAPPPARRPLRPSIFGLAEIVGAAAALLLLALVFVPGAMKAHETRQRLACQSNMRQIGVALEHYANSHERMLPVPQPSADGNWLNRDRGRRATGTAPLFLLVAKTWIRPQDVTCPGTEDRAFAGDPTGLADFPDAANCSYSFQNFFGAAAASDDNERMAAVLDKAKARPIMADRTPLFSADRFCDDVACTSNSNNHSREGQNVLFTDGRVRWMNSPEIDGDNIWLCGSTRQYRGNEASQGAGDLFFAP